MTDDRKQTGSSSYFWLVLFLLIMAPSFAQAAPSKTSAVAMLGVEAKAPDPSSNPVLANIIKLGAKLYYLGTRDGLDGWFIVKDGQVQIAYGTADKKNVIIGAMFGEDGESITTAQVKILLENNKEVAALMTGAIQAQQAINQAGGAATSPATSTPTAGTLPSVPLSPGERLYQVLSTAPGVTLGSGAPKLLMVMDTNCPHCQATWRMLRDAVMKNTLQIKMVPIATADTDSERAATVLMRSADPLNAWDKYVGADKGQGDKAQLAGTADPNLVAAIRGNHTLIDDWHIDQTPYLVYRGKDGKVKIVVGEPSNVAAILSDVAP